MLNRMSGFGTTLNHSLETVMNEILVTVLGAGAGALVAHLLNNLDPFKFFSRYRRYSGDYFGYYMEKAKAGDVLAQEQWRISRTGKISISRDGSIVFRGRIRLRNKKIYVTADSTSHGERMFLTFDQPRFGPSMSLRCIWLGEDDRQNTVASRGIISRQALSDEDAKQELIVDMQQGLTCGDMVV